jgi:hypothetical protein
MVDSEIRRTPSGLAGVVAVALVAIGLGLYSVPAFAAAEPTVTIDPTVTAGYSTAHVSGVIGPGSEEISFYAEYRPEGSSESWGEHLVESIPANAGATPVSADIPRLLPGTEYEFRLDAFVNSELHLSAEPNPTASTKVVAEPSVSIDPVSGFTATTAHLVGHIDPNAPEAAPTTQDVEGAFAVKWHFICTPECPGLSEETLAADNATHEVPADATGLLPGTTYEVELIGRNSNGEANQQAAGPVSFTTPPVAPVIKASSIAGVGAAEASVSANIVPGGAPTAYRIEYGPTTAYGLSTAESETIGSDNTEHDVSATLAGLAPDTTYHLRIVATNSAGPTPGPDLAFTTFGATVPLGGLPDERAYEQVTSTDKNGANASGEVDGTLASPDGNALLFFNEAVLPGSEGAQDFGSYLATRGETNWGTQGLLPPASIGREGHVVGVDRDLNRSYLVSRDPSVANSRGLYQRVNATRQLTLVGRYSQGRLGVAASTPDGSEMLFESSEKLAPGTTPGISNVYLWDAADQTVHLAGAMNQNTGEQPAEGSSAGPAGGQGSLLIAASEALSPNGEDVLFTATENHQIYLRRHVLAPQSALNGHEECTEAGMACTAEISSSKVSDPNGRQPATLWKVANEAAPIAFFTSAGKLTGEATTGPEDEGIELYRYDSSNEELTNLAPDHSATNGAEVVGVLGVSENGLRAYFVANGVIGDGAAKGATSGNCTQGGGEGECNLYLWSESVSGKPTIIYIGRLDANAQVSGEVSDRVDWSRTAADVAARVSRDGATLVFRSQRAQTSAPMGGVPEFYRFDATDDSVQCLTCDSSGADQPKLPTLYSYGGDFGSPFNVLEPAHNLSADGNRFIFESSARLVAADSNGIGGCPIVSPLGGLHAPRCQDVYEWEAKGTGSCDRSDQNGGCLSLLSTGTAPEPVFFDAADENGDNAFIFTPQRLVGQDRDQLVDIYDARVRGGLAGQDQTSPILCSSAEACKGVSAGPPVEASPGSATFAGPPEMPQPNEPKCKQGFKSSKRHGKPVCVKKGGSRHRKKGGSQHHQKKVHAHSGGAK